VLLQAHKPAVQELTSQLSESTSVTMRQKAELSTKEVHLQRLDGKLSEQQTKMTQLQSSVSKDRSEVQRLTAQLEEKQSLVEGMQDVVESLGTRLTAGGHPGEFAHGVLQPLSPVYLHTATMTVRQRCYCSCILVLAYFGWSTSDAVSLCDVQLHGRCVVLTCVS